VPRRRSSQQKRGAAVPAEIDSIQLAAEALATYSGLELAELPEQQRLRRRLALSHTLSQTPENAFVHHLGVCLNATGVAEERLNEMSGEWPRIQRWLDAAAGVPWYRKHLPPLLLAAGAEFRNLQHRHVARPVGRRPLVVDAQATETRALRRDALGLARSVEDLSGRLRALGVRAEKVLIRGLNAETGIDRRCLDEEDESLTWIRDAWRLTACPGEPDVLESLRLLAQFLRGSPAPREEAPAAPRRRGAVERQALRVLRSAMVDHAPELWKPTYRAKVIAAVVFASGLAPSFSPDGERATLAKRSRLLSRAKSISQ